MSIKINRLEEGTIRTHWYADTSTIITEAYPVRRQHISPSRSRYSRGEDFQAETCDLIASVQSKRRYV